MAYSEFYKSLDEAREYVESLKSQLSPENYRFVQFLHGFLENQGISEEITINGETIKVDRYIAPLIQKLNEKGYKTLACCSGLQEEHEGVEFQPDNGYLALAYDEQLYNRLKQKLEDPMLKVIKGEVYLKPAIQIDINHKGDEEKKKYWKQIEDLLLNQ